MKNHDDPKLLARKQQVDAERRAQAILRKLDRQQRNAAAITRIADATRRAS